MPDRSQVDAAQPDDQLRLIKAALEHVSYSVLITLADLHPPGPEIVYVTPAFTRMTGYAREEVIGKSPRILQGPKTERSVLDRLRRALQQGNSFRGELINYRKDRSEYLVELTIDPVRDATGKITHWVTIQKDISRRKRAEDALLQAERLAAIGTAVAGLSHESRNALQRAEAWLELLAEVVSDRPEAVQYIAKARQAQYDLHRLFEEVREFAAPLHLNRQLCWLDSVLHDTWTTLAMKCMGRDIRIRKKGTDLDLSCEVDEFAIRQVFRNVIENSLAACSDPIKIDVRFSESTLDQRPAIEVSLRDNGPGLDEEQRRRIFDEFYTTKNHGTGLGMAIVKRIVQGHGGVVVVGPQEPGAEIVVTLPKERSAE